MALVTVALAPAASADERALWPSPVAVGQRAPDFTLEDQSGNRVRLSRQRGSKVVLVFYRGYW
jgi:cytochrome oxidase Cu insertion factor (SCO1/SenC/PrrC family)